MEVVVEGVPYFITIPQGAAPGAVFDVFVPLAGPMMGPRPVRTFAQPLPPPPQPPAAIVSDNHGKWTTARYASLRDADPAWRRLSPFYASVLFIQRHDGTATDFKSYGLPGAVEVIKNRFHLEFKADLFPQPPMAFPESQAPMAQPPMGHVVQARALPPDYASHTGPPAYAAPPAAGGLPAYAPPAEAWVVAPYAAEYDAYFQSMQPDAAGHVSAAHVEAALAAQGPTPDQLKHIMERAPAPGRPWRAGPNAPFA